MPASIEYTTIIKETPSQPRACELRRRILQGGQAKNDAAAGAGALPQDLYLRVL
jgi:hypothetical protein